ncbi:MAG: outer membrane beta-barrel protein [Polyangia bacterium]|jgi:hypothetical protein|nr:outer membrane beta-barrel protein [Polyangia bacterium]
MKKTKRIFRSPLMMAVLGIALVAGSTPAAANYGYGTPIDRSGAYLGISGMGNIVLNQANAPVNGFIDQGGGLGLFLGWRIMPMFALELGYAVNFHNPVQDPNGVTVDALVLHAFTLDGKLIFPNRSIVRPFLQLGLGIYELATYADNTFYRNGIGLQLGGGLDVWLGRTLSIGGRILYHGIAFTQYIYEHRPFLSTLSIEINLQVHF